MKTPFAVTALLAALLQAPPPALGATLRPTTTLTAGVVRLSDLFDDAGPDAARVLGPAPAPGERIVVEARQLAAIARQFGVDWRPASAGARIVLDRPGRPLDRAAVLAALRRALGDAGAPEDADIDLPGFAAPLVAEGAEPALAVEQLAYQEGAGHFTAQLIATGDGMPPLRLRIAGRLREMVTLPVPTRQLPAGSRLRPGDLRLARVPASLAQGDMLRDAAEAAGLVLRHAARPGQPLRRAELERPEAVSKGARVAMRVQAPGLLLLAQGEALQGGAIGARIPVLNPASRAVLEAEITGPGQVRVTAGSTPITPPGGGGGYYSSYSARVAGR
jgi:flagella basal body P-ring formation protein FlgA